jgi:hypothetical protein
MTITKSEVSSLEITLRIQNYPLLRYITIVKKSIPSVLPAVPRHIARSLQQNF